MSSDVPACAPGDPYSTTAHSDRAGAARVGPLRLILDTNVALDWLIYQDPRIAFLDPALTLRQVTLASEARCVEELEDVLSRPALRVDQARRVTALERYRSVAEMFPSRSLPEAPRAALPQCRDADDQVFIELGVACRAFAIVTRDKELLRMHHGMRRLCHLHVVGPAEMAQLLIQ